MIKRSFFACGRSALPWDKAVEAMKGVDTSIRSCKPVPSIPSARSTGLAINVDGSSGMCWASQDIHQAARSLCFNRRNRQNHYMTVARLLLPIKDRQGNNTTI